MASTGPTWEVSFVSGASASCQTGVHSEITAARPRIPQGFTLIELMIVIAMMAILAAIAYPSYSEYIVRSKLTEATSALADMRVRMTNYFVDNRSYKKKLGTSAADLADTACGVNMPTNLHYFSIADGDCVATGTTYTITATSQAGQGLGAAGDYQYTVNQARDNFRVTVKFAGQTVNAACWLVKKGQTC